MFIFEFIHDELYVDTRMIDVHTYLLPTPTTHTCMELHISNILNSTKYALRIGYFPLIRGTRP